jgi:hypothetical protein
MFVPEGMLGSKHNSLHLLPHHTTSVLFPALKDEQKKARPPAATPRPCKLIPLLGTRMLHCQPSSADHAEPVTCNGHRNGFTVASSIEWHIAIYIRIRSSQSDSGLLTDHDGGGAEDSFGNDMPRMTLLVRL